MPWRSGSCRSPAEPQTFCIYCQREYGTFAKLKRHVLRMHPNTYASNSLTEEQHEHSN